MVDEAQPKGWTNWYTRKSLVTSPRDSSIAVASRYLFYAEKRLHYLAVAYERLKTEREFRLNESFCIVRMGLLGKRDYNQIFKVLYWTHGHIQLPDYKAEQVEGWHQDVVFENFRYKKSRWIEDDVSLLRASCYFLLRTDPTSRRNAVAELEFLSRSSDALICVEATILLCRLHLESALRDAGQLGGGVAVHTRQNFLDPIESTPPVEPDGLLKILSRAISSPYSSDATVNYDRLTAAAAEIKQGAYPDALRLLDCSEANDNVPVSPEAIPEMDIESALEELEEFVYKTILIDSSTLRRRKKLELRVDSIAGGRLSPSQELRVVEAVIRLGENKKTGSKWHGTVDTILHRFCSDPASEKHHRPCVTRIAEYHLMLAFHYKECSRFHHASNAWAYAFAAKDKAIAAQVDIVEALLLCLRAARIYTELTSVQLELTEMFDLIDEVVYPGSPRRREICSVLGNVLSSGAIDLSSDNMSARLRGYWRENLAFARLDYEQFKDAPALAWALREAAVAHRIHSTKAESEPEGLEFLSEALNLATEAVKTYETPRANLVRSFILNEYSSRSDDSAGVKEAIELQTKTLREWLELSNDNKDPQRWDVEHFLDLTFIVTPDEDAEGARVYQQYLTEVLSNPEESLRIMASHTANSAKIAYDSGHYDHCVQVASSILPHLIGPLAANTIPYKALHSIQGLAATGAAAYIHLRQPDMALGLLEFGTTLRIRSAAGQTNDTRNATTNCRNLVFALSRELVEPITYLAALEDAGFAITVKQGHIEVTWLKELTRTALGRWLNEISASSATDSEELTRGPRGSGGPSQTTVERVVVEAAHALKPLKEALSGTEIVHLIPIGHTAGIPWGPVLGHPITTTPSGTLLHQAYNRPAKQHSGRTVIANPHPIRHKEHDYANLPGAESEANDLHLDWGFSAPITGTAATRAAFEQAMSQGLEILHLSTHAEVDELSWGDRADILWTNNPATGQAETTPAQDPPEQADPPDTVFLAACSGGAPNRILPDEAISFPTSLISAGVSSVIAPLWPINDEAAHDFVTNFYENLDSGIGPAHALHEAMQHLSHVDANHKSTYGAFILTGINRSNAS